MLSRNINNTILDTPGFNVFSDGTELEDSFAVQSLIVSKCVNKISSARLALQDGNIAKEDFPASNKDEFLPGKEIEIKMGYRGNNETIFKGIVIKYGLKSQGDEASLLIIDLKDVTVKMTVGRNNRYFKDITDSEIMEEVLAGYEVNQDIEATTVTHHEMVQCYCSDWDFVVTRAEANGKLVFSNNGIVSIKAPDLSQDSVLDLLYGQNIKEFETFTDARDQFAAVSCKTWDFAQQEMVTSESTESGLPDIGNVNNADLAGVIGLESLPLQHSGRVSVEELQSWSDARLMRSRLAKVRGRIRILGFSGIKPGDVVQLGGLGDRFNGIAFVSSIGHHYALGSTWYTDLEIGLSSEWLMERHDNVMAQPSSSLLPSFQGLQIGIVTAIHDDPDGEDRIQVRLPVLDPENEGIWARVASLDAGENRGAFFRPEVDDEVIVGFINDDPRDIIVLGMLHSSARPAPFTATEENNEKGFVTRSELKLVFDDDKKCVTITTPNGNKAELNDDSGSILVEDENGNKVILDSSGITIESAADISIKASGDVNIEGTNLANKASANFKSEGSAGAELSTSGSAVIKGSLVQIN